MHLPYLYLVDLLQFSYYKYTSFLLCLQSNSIYFVYDGMSFLNGCKSGYGCDDGNGDNAPSDCRDGNEKQESCQLIRYGMWKAELSDAGQCYYLIDNLDDDDYS